MLDPEGNHNGSGAYTGDYGFYFNKDWSNVASTGVKMENRIFGAEEKFITSVFGDYSSAIGSQYDYKPFEFNAEKYKFNTRNAHGSVTETMNVKTSGITFHNNYTFPPTDGTANQVLTTDGSGNITFATPSGGGGGATDLNGLSDVTITSVANNDLLMYNSTASKWQNTNLGVSVTPTLTGLASASASLAYVLTVSNHATYDDPAYFLEVYTGSTKVVDNDDVTDNLDGTLSFTAPASGTHEIRVRCQDFGDLQSEIAVKALTTAAFGGTFRYWRVANFLGGPTNMGIKNIRFYSGAGQTGTAYPTNMTSGTAPSPFVATASYYYTPSGDTYAPWKAFDNNAGSWVWFLGRNPASLLATDWVQIDMGSNTAISSLSVGAWYTIQPTQFQILASNTGAFSGEETTVATIATTGGASAVGNIYNVG
jgi:hypothetical protein